MVIKYSSYTVNAFCIQVEKTVWKLFSFCIFRWFQSNLTYHDICGPHWWIRSYSSQASEEYKLKAECLFFICLELLFFSVLQYLAYFWRLLYGYMMPGGPKSRTEMKGEQNTMTMTKQNTSNRPYLVEEVTPQILSLGTKPFGVFTHALFKLDAYF